MDIRLDGNSDGIQVAEQVRRDFDIPVVYLTAYEDSKTLERASQTHAFGYIKKPIDSASLQGSIEMAISKHRHERYLREQRDWFSATFAAMPDAVLVADGSGRIAISIRWRRNCLDANVADVLGKPSMSLCGSSIDTGGRWTISSRWLCCRERLWRMPKGTCLEGGCGSRYAIEGTVAPRCREGGAEGVVVTFKDVTLRRFEEEQSRHDSKHVRFRGWRTELPAIWIWS